VPPPTKIGSDPVFSPCGGAAGSISAGALVSFNEQVPSLMCADDLSRLCESIFAVEEVLAESNTLILRKPGRSEAFGCSSTYRHIKVVDFPGELAKLPEFVLDLADSDAAQSTFESQPFVASGLVWAVRVRCTQMLISPPPPALSTSSRLPNSTSGPKYRMSIDTTQADSKVVTITCMLEYSSVSLEELRANDYAIKFSQQVQSSDASATSPCLQAGAGVRCLN
jgi:hypothetical protein